MRTETTSGRPTAYVPQPRSLPETTEPDTYSGDLPESSSARTAEHDTTLLVAALEELEAQRAAIEWLADADLLRLCLG